MSNEMGKPKSLEERVTARLHESIGDLITDADLKAIVERGIEKALFHERTSTRHASYGGTTVDRAAPLVDEMASKHLSEQMRTAVDAWIAKNPEKMQAAVDRAIQAGVADALMRTLDARFVGIFEAGVQQMRYSGLLPNVNS